jgi:hypothetical protein
MPEKTNIMKKTLIFAIAFILSLPSLNAQLISQKDNASIENLFLSNLVINKEKIESDTLAMVFKGTFYMVNPEIKLEDEEGIYSCRSLLNVNGGVITEVGYDGLIPLLKENFILKTSNDSYVFETAIDKLFPVTDPEDLAAHEKFKYGENTWYFIRALFFDNKSGLKVTVDQNSRITAIDYNMEITLGK